MWQCVKYSEYNSGHGPMHLLGLCTNDVIAKSPFYSVTTHHPPPFPSGENFYLLHTHTSTHNSHTTTHKAYIYQPPIPHTTKPYIPYHTTPYTCLIDDHYILYIHRIPQNAFQKRLWDMFVCTSFQMHCDWSNLPHICCWKCRWHICKIRNIICSNS